MPPVAAAPAAPPAPPPPPGAPPTPEPPAPLLQRLYTPGAQQPPCILDARPAAAFQRRRLAGSANVPLDQLERRCYLLPDKAAPLVVLLPDSNDYVVVLDKPQLPLLPEAPGTAAGGAAAAGGATASTAAATAPASETAGGAHGRSGELAATTGTAPLPVHCWLKGQPSLLAFLADRGWKVDGVLHDGADTWQASQQLGVLEQGPPAPGEDLNRRWLFAPSPLLARVAGTVEGALAQLLESGGSAGGSGTSTYHTCCCCGSAGGCQVRRALDIGCGSGRDLVWLACRQPRTSSSRSQAQHCDSAAATPSGGGKSSSSSAGAGGTAPSGWGQHALWHVTGVDSWLGALQRAQELAQYVGLGSRQVALVFGGVDAASGQLKLQPLPAKARGTTAASHPQKQHQQQHQQDERMLFGAGDLPEGGEDASSSNGSGGSGGWEALSSWCQQRSAAAATAAATVAGAEAPACSHCSAGGGAACSTSRTGCLPGGFHLILCTRFLERALLPLLPSLLAPGGFIAYHTFVDGPGTLAYGRPSGEERLLRPGELGERWFGPGQGFRVVLDEVAAAPSDGRELSAFLAQRLPSGV